MRRWGLGGGLLLLVGLLVLAAGWRDVTAARAQLNDARSELGAVVDDPAFLRSSTGRADARESIDAARARLGQAASRVRGSIPLRVASMFPAVDRQRTGVLRLIADATEGTSISSRFLNEVDGLADRTALEDGAVPLSGLEELERAVRKAGHDLTSLRRDPTGLWSSLAYARRQLNVVAARTSTGLTKSADAIGAARALMGADGPRRYLVAVQNNAEMRDQGMTLSYAVVQFDNGRMTVEKTGPIVDLNLESPANVALPPTTQKIFGVQNPLKLWQNTNATADWPVTARSMVAMYKAATGEDIDGIVALDVPGLAALLRVIGPVPNPAGGGDITADNASTVLLHDFYAQVPRGEQGLRKERLAEVAGAVVAKLTTGRHDAVALGRELGAAAAGGHFRLWSKNDQEEKVFERTGLGGGPASHLPDRTFHLSVQNASSTKLDYYQRQRVRMDVYLTELGTAVVRTSLTMINTAPKDGAPSYQLGPSGATQKKPGQYPARIYFWGPKGAKQLDSVEESGLTLNFTSALIEPGESQTIRFESVIPQAVRNGRLELRLVPQPILVPADLRVVLHAEGWSVDGERSISRAWDRTVTVAWDVKS